MQCSVNIQRCSPEVFDWSAAHELPTDVRLKISNSGAQLLLKKFDFGNSKQKSLKNGHQTFLFLSNITGFLYFVPIFCMGL